MRDTNKFHFFSFFRNSFLYIITVSFTMEIKKSPGGESAGVGQLRPAGGDPGLDHLQKYFFDSLCFFEWTWPF